MPTRGASASVASGGADVSSRQNQTGRRPNPHGTRPGERRRRRLPGTVTARGAHTRSGQPRASGRTGHESLPARSGTLQSLNGAVLLRTRHCARLTSRMASGGRRRDGSVDEVSNHPCTMFWLSFASVLRPIFKAPSAGAGVVVALSKCSLMPTERPVCSGGQDKLPRAATLSVSGLPRCQSGFVVPDLLFKSGRTWRGMSSCREMKAGVRVPPLGPYLYLRASLST